MTTVDQIAAKALDKVSAKITDVIHPAEFGGETGRVVFDREKAPKGWPSPKPQARVQSAWLEGFTSWPGEGDTFEALGVTYYVLSANDLLRADGFYNVQCAAAADILWKIVAVQGVTRTPSGGGEYTDTWADLPGLSTVQAGVYALNGDEAWVRDRRESSAEWRMLMPYNSQINATRRIVMDGRSYGVEWVNNDQKRGKWLVLDLTEGRDV